MDVRINSDDDNTNNNKNNNNNNRNNNSNEDDNVAEATTTGRIRIRNGSRIPPTVLLSHMIQYLDRTSWNHLARCSQEFYHGMMVQPITTTTGSPSIPTNETGDNDSTDNNQQQQDILESTNSSTASITNLRIVPPWPKLASIQMPQQVMIRLVTFCPTTYTNTKTNTTTTSENNTHPLLELACAGINGQLFLLNGITGTLSAVIGEEDEEEQQRQQEDNNNTSTNPTTIATTRLRRRRRARTPVCLVYSSDGTYLAMSSADLSVRIWTATATTNNSNRWSSPPLIISGYQTANLVLSIAFIPPPPSSSPTAGAAAPTCPAMFACGGTDRSIQFYRISDGSCLRRLLGHTQAVSSIDVCRDVFTSTPSSNHDVDSKNGIILCSGSKDGTIRIWWDVDTNYSNNTHANDATATATMNGNTNSNGSNNNNTVTILDGQIHQDLVVSFSPNGKVLVSASQDGSITIFKMADIRAARNEKEYNNHYNNFNNTSSSSVSTMLTIVDRKVLNLLSIHGRISTAATTGRNAATAATLGSSRRGESNEIVSFAFSPDSKRIAWSIRGGPIRVLSLLEDEEQEHEQDAIHHRHKQEQQQSSSSSGRIMNTSTIVDTTTINNDHGGILTSHSFVHTDIATTDNEIVRNYYSNRHPTITTVRNSSSFPSHSVAFASDGRTLAFASYTSVWLSSC